METRRDLAFDKSLGFLHFLLRQPDLTYDWDRSKNRLTGTLQGSAFAYRLPLPLPIPDAKQAFPQYLADLPPNPQPYLLILIQAGHSAIAYFDGEELLHHKVIKKYMVRGNGRAQVGYLQTRGKSKAGSRVRLANTVTFFEEINEKLREWDVTERATRILISCGEKLRPLWYASHITPPFDKDDPRISKVPFDVQRPGLEELQNIHKSVLRSRWEGSAAPIDAFFAGE
jgi:Bacteroidetes VLRF1 release factor